jgi:uncharacterized DUF497 family protein
MTVFFSIFAKIPSSRRKPGPRSEVKLFRIRRLCKQINQKRSKSMKIEFDPEKRNQTLYERGLDFCRAGEVFAGRHYTADDLRRDYGELRKITAGLLLDGRMVVMSGRRAANPAASSA